ncbi:MAG: LLM class flavin-dependent oxidoreductase [Rhodospirillaceae bacterium]|nr:LLM class flavin-dependent oxidoreductase [Rhodospirillaceae bacterium]
MLTLSVLDQSIAVEGRPQGAAIRETVALAQYCESLGYHRFWVSEHHNHPAIVGTSPEILIAAIAVKTKRIRVGSAGVMLPHYSPFKVAEQFRVLDALAPGRIDLGLGRAPGSDGLTAFALNPNASERPQQFPNDVMDLDAWLHGEPLQEGHSFARLKAQPQGETAPEIWMLGSSAYGAQVSAYFGLPYSFAWFFTNGQGGAEALKLYRKHYRPSERHPKPISGICVWALAAETHEEAQYHFSSRARWQLHRDKGLHLTFGSPEDAMAATYNENEEARIVELRKNTFVGTGIEVAERINELAGRLKVNEVAVVTWTHSAEARRNSYAEIARAFGLQTE